MTGLEVQAEVFISACPPVVQTLTNTPFTAITGETVQDSVRIGLTVP